MSVPVIEPSSIGIIALVPDRWNDMWQVRHHLLSRVAEQCSVVWMTPSHHWREVLRWKSHAGASEGGAPPGTRLEIRDAPIWLPRFHGHPGLDAITLAVRLKAARKSLIRNGARHIVLYLWRPQFAAALDLVRYDVSCYHIDDEYSFSTTSVGTSADELALLKRVDQVFIHSDTLLRTKGGINAHTAHVPNGVDYKRYSTKADEPLDLAVIPRPRIGYTGWLKPQMDWPLLQALVRRHSEWSFVFIGPMQKRQPRVEAQVELLKQAPNVYMLGARPTAALHAYNQHFDVCLMPYDVNPYTEFIYPVKVHEYLATGNPVVASALPNLREFSDVLSLARDPDEWSTAIASSLASSGGERLRAARRLVAQRHDWGTLAERVVKILQTRLAGHTQSS